MSVTFYDSETAGLAAQHPTIQMAAVAVDKNFVELEAFEIKLQFDIALADPEALKMNHWSAEVWEKEAVPPAQAVSLLARFLKRHASVECISKAGKSYSVARLAGHNLQAFDKPRLDRMFRECAAFLPAHPLTLDTCQLALWQARRWEKQPENFKLGTLCKFFGIEVNGALHGALTDCRAAVALTQKLLEGGNGAGA